MKSRPTENPPIRFRDVTITYDEGDGPPPATITLLEDHSRSILSHNDSPDLGFSWSANPYRGCQTACAYCLSGDTPILLGDSRTKPLSQLVVGDDIYGTRLNGKYRYFTRTKVLKLWTTLKVAYRVVLSDGTSLVASGDHRFLTERGWKYVAPVARPGQRPFLTTNNTLIGSGRFATPPIETPYYRRGYLCGLLRGDGMLRHGEYFTRSGRRYVQNVVRLALVDLEPLRRASHYLALEDVQTQEYLFQAARPGYRELRAIRASSRPVVDRVLACISFDGFEESDDWHKGFLAGIFDAEGSHHLQVLRISNTDEQLIQQVVTSCRRFGFDVVIERDPESGRNKPVSNVRLRGGLSERLRFFHTTGPAITRKWDLEGGAIKFRNELKVVSVTRLGLQQLFDITTGTGDFIANGVVSHNCYARPTHEYLDLGAGTDFDTKIVIKPKAPELLREAFDKPSWKGELIMFSGVTDCYQPIERELQLTKQCLEVCLEYRNPVSIISKHALVERDVELIAELAREAGAHLSVSLAWIDPELARKIEPWAASPQRRLKVVETFAKAGIPVGVMMAPIIPGLNDNQIVKVLEAARAAGAEWAGWSLLRLPHAVKEVFQDRLRVVLPLAADKIMHRVRETRGGEKLYDSTFHVRGRGVGVYAETIKALFETTVKRLGFNQDDEPDPPSRFRRPNRSNQLSLF